MNNQTQLKAGQQVKVNGKEYTLKERRDRFGLERWETTTGKFVYASDLD